MLIGDPSYFPSRMVKPTGMVARSICIMDHPFNGTNNAESTQIIIPGRQASLSPHPLEYRILFCLVEYLIVNSIPYSRVGLDKYHPILYNRPFLLWLCR